MNRCEHLKKLGNTGTKSRALCIDLGYFFNAPLKTSSHNLDQTQAQMGIN